MRRFFLVSVLVVATLVARAELWHGLDASNWVSGPKVTELHLLGKVVFVCTWDAADPAAPEALARAEKVWGAYRGKPFLVLGGVLGDVAAARKAASDVTFPNYAGAGPAQRPAVRPGFTVVNHRGRIVYAGKDERGAEEALVTALGYVGRPYALTGEIVFGRKHPYRKLADQLVLGKKISGALKQLEADVKKGESKASSTAQKAKAAQAAEILMAVAAAKIEVRKEIAEIEGPYPVGALKLVREACVTYPELVEEYKADLPALEARAAEQKARADALRAAARDDGKTEGKAKGEKAR